MANFTKIAGKKGTRWRAQIRRKGFETQCGTFDTEAEAKRWARAIEGKLDKDEDPGANRSLLVAEVLQAYREGNELSASQLTRVGHLDKVLGRERVTKLCTSDLASFCKLRIEVDGVKPQSTRSDINTLSAAFKFYAGKHDVAMPSQLITDSRRFLTKGRLIAESPNRNRRPDERELRDLLKHLPREYHDVLRFAIATSMRRGEIHGLVWSDVVESDRCIWVRARKHPTDKANNDGLVPLLGVAWDILQRQKRVKGSDRVFHFAPKDYSGAITAACEKAGISNLRGHDFRHEGISRLFEAGLSIPQVQIISGHKTWSQLQKYTHLKPRDLHKHKLPARRSVVA